MKPSRKMSGGSLHDGSPLQRMCPTGHEGEKTSKNEEFVRMVAEENVRITIRDIRERSPILREMEDQGRIKIVGAAYDMDSGAVHLLDE